MNLKQYQSDTLSILRRFFEEARMAGPKNAYESITQEPDQAMRLGGYAGAYVPLRELFDVPYVCLRLPTGGGKTILAAHAVSVARNAWIEKDYPVVLWLVPTNTIRQQTVEALKEGWDCSFAYVFCSVSRIQSAKDVEQLLGRVLRMPYARRRGVTDLNKAYAFLSEPSFGEAAKGLTDKLVGMGFEEDEALDNIEPVQRAFDDQGDLFGPRQESEPVFRYTTQATPEVLSKLKEVEPDGLQVRKTTKGEVEVAVTGWISEDNEKAICETLPEPQRKEFVDAVEKYRDEVKDQVRKRSMTFVGRNGIVYINGISLRPGLKSRFHSTMPSHLWMGCTGINDAIRSLYHNKRIIHTPHLDKRRKI